MAIAAWSVLIAGIISLAITRSCRLLEISQKFKHKIITGEFWLHVTLFVSGSLTLQMSIRSSSSCKLSIVATTDFLGLNIPPFLSSSRFRGQLKSPAIMKFFSSRFSLYNVDRKVFRSI